MIKGKRYRVSLTQDMLKNHLHYDPKTGVWTRRQSLTPWVKVGNVAGSLRKNGRYIYVEGVGYYSSNLAWLYMTGEWPQFLIDHRDGDNSNDRWSNLRPATYSQNIANSKKSIINSTGFKGVRKLGSRYVARVGIRVNEKRKIIHLGCFETPEEAHRAYQKAASDKFGQFARFQ